MGLKRGNVHVDVCAVHTGVDSERRLRDGGKSRMMGGRGVKPQRSRILPRGGKRFTNTQSIAAMLPIEIKENEGGRRRPVESAQGLSDMESY